MLVSAAISPRGVPRDLVFLWHEGAFVLVVSYELLLELQSVLLREKFRRYRPDTADIGIGSSGLSRVILLY